MAEVWLSPEAQRQLDRLPRTIRARVRGIVERLQQWPNVSGAKALSGRLAGRFRVRTGDYRLQFHVLHENVIIERIGHRSRFYEE